jgi:hypothetical protein
MYARAVGGNRRARETRERAVVNQKSSEQMKVACPRVDQVMFCYKLWWRLGEHSSPTRSPNV